LRAKTPRRMLLFGMVGVEALDLLSFFFSSRLGALA
jgi:hypothetical protein